MIELLTGKMVAGWRERDWERLLRTLGLACVRRSNHGYLYEREDGVRFLLPRDGNALCPRSNKNNLAALKRQLTQCKCM